MYYLVLVCHIISQSNTCNFVFVICKNVKKSKGINRKALYMKVKTFSELKQAGILQHLSKISESRKILTKKQNKNKTSPLRDLSYSLFCSFTILQASLWTFNHILSELFTDLNEML